MFFCLVFVMPLRVSVYLMSWLSFVVSSCEFVTHWYPLSGVVLDCIDF